ncbi:MAG: SMC family ATPase [Dehalococcoidia bacterium]
MIPLRLEMRNFLCYGEGLPPLSLEGIHIVCLSGDNGSGKSALLDAMTWALWGEARGRSQEELVHHGRAEMAVELDFAVGGQRYRVARRYHRRRAQTQCLLQVAQNGSFRNLAEGVRQVEAQLGRILHLDYQTFVNSAFLRQGRADEFTLKRPAEKREVLADILGLSYFNRLEDRAKNHAREKGREKERLEMEMEHIAQELARRPQYQAELDQATRLLTELEASLQTAAARHQEARRRLAEMERQAQRLQEAEATLERAQEEATFWQDQAGEQQRQVEGHQALLARSAQIEEGYQSLSHARRQEEELGHKLLQFTEEERRRTALQAAIENARRDLEREERPLSQGLAGLEEQAARLPALEAALVEARARLEGLQEEAARLAEQRDETEALSRQLARLETEDGQLKRELEELKEKRHLLVQEQARCPLCGAGLGEGGVRELRSHYEEEARSRADRLTGLHQERTAVSQRLSTLRPEVARREKALEQERAQAQGQVPLLESRAAEATAARAEAATTKVALDEVVARRIRGDYAPRERRELAECESRIAATGYDPQHHQEVRRQREALQDFEAELQRLEEARRQLPTARQSLERATQAAAQKGAEVAALRNEVAGLQPTAEALLGLRQEAEAAAAEDTRLGGQRDEAQRRRGGLERELARLEQQESEQAAKAARREQTGEEEALYNRLTEAFGKKGVQALLVEAALPELEEEADALLKRLTEGRMALRFETQDAEGREILDIKISDELGTRSYEMYSGGESFRINFALRVALSRLLARRSGSPMRLLIVDEGFGTQDTSGRERLIEAINAISPEFDTIIAITHLEELKELFPVRIELTKTPQGSTISVNM